MQEIKLKSIIENHLLWLSSGGIDGKRADLSGANLSRADLSCCIGNMVQVKSLQIERYKIAYTGDFLQIGCKKFLISDWWLFDDLTIQNMDSKALDWWRTWKPIIKNIIETSPAEK